MTDRELLGLDEGATQEQVKSTYRALALVHHPDRGGDAEEFARISAAYRRLMAVARPSGAAPEPRECPTCEGRKKIEVRSGFTSVKLTCETCGGSGEI